MMKDLEINENLNENTEIVGETLIEPNSVLDEEEEFYDYTDDIINTSNNSNSWAPLNIVTSEDLEEIDEDNDKDDYYPEWEKLEQKSIYSSTAEKTVNETDNTDFEPLIVNDKKKNTSDDEKVVIDPTFVPLGETPNLTELDSLSTDDLMFDEDMMRDLEKLKETQPEVEDYVEAENNFEKIVDNEDIILDNKITENFIEAEKEDEQQEDTDEIEKYIDESLLLAELTEVDEEILKPFENFDNLIVRKNKNNNDEEDNDESYARALESLNIITNYAILATGLDVITEEEFDNIDKLIENADEKYSEELLKKQNKFHQQKRAYELIKEISDEFVEHNNRDIDNFVSIYKDELKEYDDIISKFDKDKEEYDNACAELVKMVEDGKYKNDEKLNTQLINYIKDNYPKDLIITSDDKALTDCVNRIKKGKWNIEAYQDYIEEFYSDEKLNEIKELIKNFEDDKRNKEDVELYRREFIINEFGDLYLDDNGNITYVVEKDDKELINLQNKKEKLENISKLKNKIGVHPLKIKNEIIQLIKQNNSDKDKIKEKVDLLLMCITDKKIEYTFESDVKESDSLDKKIIAYTKEKEAKEKLLAELKRQHDELSYENDTSYLTDIAKLQKYITKDKELDLEIAKTKLIMNRSDNLKKFTIANIVIAVKEKEKKKLNKLRKRSEKDPEKIKNINVKIKIIDKIIHKYRQDRIRYFRDIYFAKGFAGKDKLEKLIKQKEKNRKLINRITNEIEDKKKNYGYIDQDLRISLEEDINSLNIEINNLQNIKEKMDYKAVKELTENVLCYDKKNELNNNEKNIQTNNILSENTFKEESDEILEEIDNFKEPKKGLLAKIKSIDFKKIANSAITKITLAVATVAMGVGLISGIHSVKNDNATKNDDLSKNNNTDKIVEESDTYQEDTIENEINKEVNKEDNSVQITVTNPEISEEVKEEEKVEIEENEVIDTSNNDFVNISKIATSLEKSARGEYVPEEYIDEDRFSNENIKRFEYMEKDGQLIRRIYAEDGTSTGTAIGFENVTDVETSSKTR